MSVISCSNVTVYRAVTIFRMIERKGRPTDTKMSECVCVGTRSIIISSGKTYFGYMKGQRKRGEARLD
jgi:hypothetical protein